MMQPLTARCAHCGNRKELLVSSPLQLQTALTAHEYGFKCDECRERYRAYLEKALAPADGEDSAGAS